MDKLALILSLVSLMISFLAIANKKETVSVDKPTKKMGAILFKQKTPEQIRFQNKIKKGEEIKIDELC